ncbi:MAG TPA: RdgB/HAM1 family non-canonical purine NTP pyrophosphatase [Candidatus Kapabacteria bacterium]|jgi:XTP/dITP diphosphohydrolase|nr:RdgB/HAM1 family non-canonical purine NTP pyrophosphatase [Candidatus Kapabacteria bacterium]
MTIVLATHNRHKRDELLAVLRAELGDRVDLKTLDDIEPAIGEIPETGNTLEENALIKARAVHDQTQLPTIADDTGLEVSALGGAPGVYSARYAGERATYTDNVNKLLDELKGKSDRSAKFSTVIAYIDPLGKEHLFRGEVIGSITEASHGSNGFGYDPVFAPTEDAHDRTFAEMSDEEKNAISHRGRALRLFVKSNILQDE